MSMLWFVAFTLGFLIGGVLAATLEDGKGDPLDADVVEVHYRAS